MPEQQLRGIEVQTVILL